MNIHQAAECREIGIVKCLLLQGVKIDEKNSEGNQLDVNKRNKVSNIHNV